MKPKSGWLIVAQQTPTRVLVQVGPETGRVLDRGALTLYPEIEVASITARGYWQPYAGDATGDLPGLLDGIIDDEGVVP